jgi:heptosyltransferase-2
MLAMLAGIPERVGFSTSAGRRLYTRIVPYRDDLHHAERLWRLAVGADVPPPPPETIRPRLYPGDEEAAAVEILLAEHGWRGEPMVALAPGSVWATKRWPYFPELALRLAARWRIALLGGPRDTDVSRAVVEVLGPSHRPIVATAKLSLLGSAELLRRAAALVTNDSAPLHLASAMGTPTVAVFGPTVPEFGFGPLAPRHAIAGHPTLACRPCDRHGPQRCPLTHWRCMRELTPEAVESMVERVIPPSLS